MSSTDASSNESGDIVRLSNESVSSAASNEYEIVNPAEEADFKIAGNGNESDLKVLSVVFLRDIGPRYA